MSTFVEEATEEFTNGLELQDDTDLESVDSSSDEVDAITSRCVPKADPINRIGALKAFAADLELKLPWIETMDITATEEYEVPDPEDELKRELAFYTQAMDAINVGKQKVLDAGVAFTRPDDYFAEMVKSDDHMLRIRKKLLEESKSIKAGEDARRQRELKKFGKKIQNEKVRERQEQKARDMAKIKALKRKRSGSEFEGVDDMFDVEVTDDDEGDTGRGHSSGRGKKEQNSGKKRSMNRAQRDRKYGFGGKKRFAKSNTAESTGDFEGRKLKKKAKRPGKSKRKNMK
ncbi:RRNA processing protein [Dispira parvispora]|uniref:rRNA processing protein n=1 Tax=Dispira parvispora TaxID=1520584 RepID=A0A9W8ASZ9_9FUNG|nr:RRNA processing protein [Dispira parvispora]